jgi:hypothetical protein
MQKYHFFSEQNYFMLFICYKRTFNFKFLKPFSNSILSGLFVRFDFELSPPRIGYYVNYVYIYKILIYKYFIKT